MSHTSAAETLVGVASGLALPLLTQQKRQKQGQPMVAQRRLQSRRTAMQLLSRPMPRPVQRRQRRISGRQRHRCAFHVEFFPCGKYRGRQCCFSSLAIVPNIHCSVACQPRITASSCTKLGS